IDSMVKGKKLRVDQVVPTHQDQPAICTFVTLNSLAGRPWTLAPLSTSGTGFLTFSELELAALFHKREKLHCALKELIGLTNENRRISQKDVTDDWLAVQTPGRLVQNFVAPVNPRSPDGQRLRGRHKKRAGIAASIDVTTRRELRSHINSVRNVDFDPCSYEKKGYYLTGSIKTDGHQLQLIGYKLRVLNSVKFKRYPLDMLPDRLTSTTAGTNDFLKEARNVFKTSHDV
ncbi:hypothetical protein BG004_007043, partial [Podila humilis]